MAQGFSGGFFLPAQRSMHCKGGFFATDASVQRLPQHQKPQERKANSSAEREATERRDSQRDGYYHDQDVDIVEESEVFASGRRSSNSSNQPNAKAITRAGHTAATISSSSSRFIRPRHEKLKASKSLSSQQNKRQESASNDNSNNSSRLFYPGNMRETPGLTEKGNLHVPGRDVNSKFELAMQELNQIKGEYDLKHQRQNSAPALVFAHGGLLPNKISASTSNQVRQTSVQVPYVDPSLQSARSSVRGPETPTATASELKQTSVSAPEERNLNSPRQRLQVAEMVMRKLYRKNLQTEEQVAKLKEENAQLMKKMQQLENEPTVTTNKNNSSQPLASSKSESESNRGNQGDEEETGPASVAAVNTNAGFVCASCFQLSQLQSIAGDIPSLANPPTLESVTRIDQQQLDYLRHLAAEQDKTITSLKIRIEDLSGQLGTAKHQLQQTQSLSSSASSFSGRGGKSPTPRQIVNRLQSKLQDALSESERQKLNYMKMKKDFQHLLGLKTKTLYENPAQLNSSARELLQLMEKKLAQIESEHSQNLSLYNVKLYEVEQQTCESYVQKKMMEEEVQRIARDVKQRDEVDVQIEQCMVGVFERLRQVELENVLLKTTTTTITPIIPTGGQADDSSKATT